MKINNFMYTCYVVHYYLNITDSSNHNLDKLLILEIKPLN